MLFRLNINLPQLTEKELKEKTETNARCGISDLYDLPIDVISPRFFVRSNAEDSEPVRQLFGATADDVEMEDVSDGEDEAEKLYLRKLDPKDWKQQDHYRVLGLSALRCDATDDDIKQAHRKRVLKHHPDKKASGPTLSSTTAVKDNRSDKDKGKIVYDDLFFKCIQKAWDQLSDPVKRRQFDSVDKGVDDSVPSENTLKSMPETKFYPTMGAIFKREARFSKKGPVPDFGDEQTEKNTVMSFYNFWYNFDSWRTFEYEDKEDMHSTENRDDKRYLDKKNKAERAKKKSDDNSRLRAFVDLTLKYDPRIARFKESEKTEKGRKKKEREESQQAAQVQTKKKEEEEKQAQLRSEEEAKQKALSDKQDKQQRVKAIKKEKKAIKSIVTKDFNYLCRANTTAPVDAMESLLADLEKLFEFCSDISGLEAVRERLEGATLSGGNSVDEEDRLHNVKDAFEYEITRAKSGEEEARLQRERAAALRVVQQQAKQARRPWSVKELQVLIKAANMFPGGTGDRWDKIATYICEHSGEPLRAQDEIISKSKEVQKGVTSLDAGAVKEMQAQQKKHNDTAVTLDISTRDSYEFDGTEASVEPSTVKKSTSAKTNTTQSDSIASGQVESGTASTWTSQQQEQLQQALKLYPPTYKEIDRFDRVAELVEGKNKKECMLRVKHLAEQVKAKKTNGK